MRDIVERLIQPCLGKVQMSLTIEVPAVEEANVGLSLLDPTYALAANLAERHLLGYLMLNGRAWLAAAKVLDPGDFEGYLHCRIYLAMEALASCGEPIDVVMLSEFLDTDEHYRAAGGLQLLGELALGTPIHHEQVSGLARLLRGFGVLRSSLNPYQEQRRLCSLLEAKLFGWSHGKSWIATVEDSIRQEMTFPQAWLGQRICYVYDELDKQWDDEASTS